MVKATGTGLLDLHGIGRLALRGCWLRPVILPASLAGPFRILDRHRPIGSSSGDSVRHRLSRGGNWQISRALHMMAAVQLQPHRRKGVLRRQGRRGKTTRLREGLLTQKGAMFGSSKAGPYDS